MIGPDSSYAEVLAEIEAAVADVTGDMPEVNPDDVFHDVTLSLLWDADPEVARQLCTAHGFRVPPHLIRGGTR